MRSSSRRMIGVLLLIAVLAAAGWAGWFFTHHIRVQRQFYRKEITQITITDPAFSDYDILNRFPQLECVDLTQLDLSVEDFDRISEILTGSEDILWMVPFQGKRIPNTTTRLTITPQTDASQLELVRYFPQLQKVQADYSLCEPLAQMAEYLRSRPEVKFTCQSQVYGVAIDENTDTLDLNDFPISELNSIRYALRTFPGITRVEMKECGVADEDMGALREEYPDTKFVWNLHILEYVIPTDAVAFSTLVYAGQVGTDEDFAPLFQYCTDLVALDLGHHHLKDISAIRNLPKLQILILFENDIEDISPLADLKDLNFMELCMNEIGDLTPLSDLQNLEDLNLCINFKVENARSLVNCRNMKNLYMSSCNLSGEDLQYIIQNKPEGCHFSAWERRAVNNSWRDLSKTLEIRRIFRRWKDVVAIESWDNVTYRN